MLVIGLVSVSLGWLPAGGVEDPLDPGLGSRLLHAIMPVAVLTFFYACHWARYTRSAVLEVLDADYVRAARAKGLSERVVLTRHVLRNALIPIVTIVTLSLPALFSGSLVIESVFSYPGMGRLIVQSVTAGDHLVAVTAFMIIAALTMAATFLADVVYWLIDPRMRTDTP